MSNRLTKDLTPQELDKEIQKLKIEKSLLLQNSLYSQNPEVHMGQEEYTYLISNIAWPI